MKVWNILKKVGGTALRIACPAAGELIDVVNEFLPEDKKLPGDATGSQLEEAVMENLSPDQQAEIMNRKFDVEIKEIKAHSTNLKTLAEADIAGASTRPEIAMMMAKTVVFTIIVMVSMLAVAILKNNIKMIAELAASWQLVLAIIATPCALLRAYFAMRTKEKGMRANFAAGQPPSIGKHPAIEYP